MLPSCYWVYFGDFREDVLEKSHLGLRRNRPWIGTVWMSCSVPFLLPRLPLPTVISSLIRLVHTGYWTSSVGVWVGVEDALVLVGQGTITGYVLPVAGVYELDNTVRSLSLPPSLFLSLSLPPSLSSLPLPLCLVIMISDHSGLFQSHPRGQPVCSCWYISNHLIWSDYSEAVTIVLPQFLTDPRWNQEGHYHIWHPGTSWQP